MSDTPLLDELEKGPLPSYVKELKRMAKTNKAAEDLYDLPPLIVPPSGFILLFFL